MAGWPLTLAGNFSSTICTMLLWKHCASLILLLKPPLSLVKGFSYPETGFCLCGQWFMDSVIRNWIENPGVHHKLSVASLCYLSHCQILCIELKYLLRYLDLIAAINTTYASLSMNSKWTRLWSPGSIKCWRTNRTTIFIPRSVSRMEKSICPPQNEVALLEW